MAPIPPTFGPLRRSRGGPRHTPMGLYSQRSDRCGEAVAVLATLRWAFTPNVRTAAAKPWRSSTLRWAFTPNVRTAAAKPRGGLVTPHRKGHAPQLAPTGCPEI